MEWGTISTVNWESATKSTSAIQPLFDNWTILYQLLQATTVELLMVKEIYTYGVLALLESYSSPKRSYYRPLWTRSLFEAFLELPSHHQIASAEYTHGETIHMGS